MRETILLDTEWRFIKDDPPGAETLDFDDSAWKQVDVPHDWAITGSFDQNNDVFVTQVLEDGDTVPRKYYGRTGGLPHVGKGWYRRSFHVPEGPEGMRVYLEFDGVMSYSRIFVNGKDAGGRPYGYASFSLDITPFVKHDAENVLAVSAEVKPEASRWYPGAGIYRNVRLVLVDPVHVAQWGVRVVTPEVSESSATIGIDTSIVNTAGKNREVTLQTVLLDPSGREVAKTSSYADIQDEHVFKQKFTVLNPSLWSDVSPNLYRAVSDVIVEGRAVDTVETTFGVRSIRFDSDKGFLLNEKVTKFKGVCMHHDLGALGAAVNFRALERQFEILADMGCNAIRTSHNPPTPELLDLCDSMGFLVIDEAFDEWRQGKCVNGYNRLFDDWAEKDLREFIMRDRNHPCVVMWSIGNEIREQLDENGAEVARFLVDICHDEDPTRPTTAGFNGHDKTISNGLADVVDVPGWNYQPENYTRYHKDHPQWPMYGSENESCVSSRGEYRFPVEETKEREGSDPKLQVSSYDMCSPTWGCSPDVGLAAQDDQPFSCGEFMWTGFDYLGEPTPYNFQWPSRSSYFGAVDLCGLPKDRFYAYRAKWREDADTLHLFPHWTWPGREGEVTPVHCYTNHDSAELFLNGKSMGVRRKNPGLVYDRYRLRWNDVVYEPGAIKVVAFGPDGNPVGEQEVRTAGAPISLELVPDRPIIRADGKDLSFVTVKVVDDSGVLCPDADNLLNFSIEGPGRILASDNGDPTDTESFAVPHCTAFHGMCVVIVGSLKGSPGRIVLSVSGDGLESRTVEINANETA